MSSMKQHFDMIGSSCIKVASDLASSLELVRVCRAACFVVCLLVCFSVFSIKLAHAQIILQPVKKERLAADISRLIYKIPTDSAARFYRVAVPMPRGASSFTATAIAVSPVSLVTLRRVGMPSNRVTYKYSPDKPLSDFRAIGVAYPLESAGEISFLHPMSPRTPVEYGTYNLDFEIRGPVAGLRSLTVIIKHGLAPRQAIDFDIWVTLKSPERRSSGFQAKFGDLIRKQMNALLTPHKLRVGQLRFYNTSMQETQRLSRPHVDEVRAMCRLMQRRVPQKRAVSVIWVDEILYQPDFTFGGIASGQPGSVFVPDSSSTCVLAAYKLYGDQLAQHAINFLHEGAHLMGLPHTTELDGLSFDTFEDTPECHRNHFDGRPNPRFGYKGLKNGEVDDFECGIRGGANNFLFYGGMAEFEPFYISPEQAWVLKRHPAFYPVR